MRTGIVKMYDADRGFGFIHIGNVAEEINELRKGQRVRFNQRPSSRKPGTMEAIDVVLA